MKNDCKDTTLYIQQTYEKLGTDSEYFNKVVNACVNYLVGCIRLSAKPPKEKFSPNKEKADDGVKVVYGRTTERKISSNIKNILKEVLKNKIKNHFNPYYTGPKFLLFDTASHYREAGKNGYNTLFKPSADRIDCEGDYVDGNIDIKTMYDNKGKGGNSESDFNEYNNSNKLNNNKMKNQNNTLNNNTTQLTADEDRLIKYFVETNSVNYAVMALTQLTTAQSVVTIKPKLTIQTNGKKSSYQRDRDVFATYLENNPLEYLKDTDNLNGYTDITVRGSKGNDFSKLKISPIGKFIVKENIQLYKGGKSEYYIKTEDYSKFMENNKSTKMGLAA